MGRSRPARRSPGRTCQCCRSAVAVDAQLLDQRVRPAADRSGSPGLSSKSRPKRASSRSESPARPPCVTRQTQRREDSGRCSPAGTWSSASSRTWPRPLRFQRTVSLHPGRPQNVGPAVAVEVGAADRAHELRVLDDRVRREGNARSGSFQPEDPAERWTDEIEIAVAVHVAHFDRAEIDQGRQGVARPAGAAAGEVLVPEDPVRGGDIGGHHVQVPVPIEVEHGRPMLLSQRWSASSTRSHCRPCSRTRSMGSPRRGCRDHHPGPGPPPAPRSASAVVATVCWSQRSPGRSGSRTRRGDSGCPDWQGHPRPRLRRCRRPSGPGRAIPPAS